MAERLDPLTLPLQGSRLIEASAGTGKTWTIAALYVRLVLGHGDSTLGRPLQPGEVLVMSFTKAATRELSDRIRSRLVEAAAHFRGQAGEEPDTFLAGLLQACPAGPAREQAAWRLAMAAEAMDDAAVHTIDAWCQRMLREHAFDSGCLFDEELQASEAALAAEAVRDYWRQQVYPLDEAAVARVLAQWKDPEALQHSLKGLLGQPLPATAGQGSLAEALHARQAQMQALKAGWAPRAQALLDWLQGVWGDKNHPAAKAAPAKRWAPDWLAHLAAWAEGDSLDAPKLSDAAVAQLGAQAIRAKAGDPQLPLPDGFEAFDTLVAALATLPPRSAALRLHAAAHVSARMQQAKRQAGSFGFSDLLERLDQALDDTLNGDKARRLRQRIVDQYPAALIDEFQDTSPVQLRIFDRLYRIASNDPARVLLLIGDPKQAIYSFRGADIYSYLRARRATEGRHHVLGTNHRSTQALVAAVNHLFRAAEDRAGEGAFQFRDANAAGSPGTPSALPFVDVDAKGRQERFVTGQGVVAAITAVPDPELRKARQSRELFAELCAERIATWLNDPQAGFEQPDRPFRRLRPADVAVLVRSGTEAQAVRWALGRRGLASVYLSDKDSVFQTDEAADLLRLLQAVAAPRDVRLARAALATSLLGFTLDELLQLATDDALFDAQCERLQQLHAAWQAQGVLAMLRRALHLFGLPARLLAPAAGGEALGGERRLTNLLHLAELLQAASEQVEGEQALIRWLAQQLADSAAGVESGTGGDERVLRLESDADLVQVVTVHKSKGLEYPVVLLPFAAHFRDVDSGEQAVLQLPGDDGLPQLVLAPSDAQQALAERERQREQLRLLYVALTRARHTLWLGMSLQNDKPWHRSAIGYLLSGAEKQAPEQRLQDVQALAAACPQVVVQPAPGFLQANGRPARTPVRRGQDLPPLVAAPAYRAAFDRQWTISSYSALVRDAAWAAGEAGPLPGRVRREDEPDGTAAELVGPRPAAQPWHRFPRGAFAGNFLHDQLEWLAAEGFALDTDAALQDRLQRRCERQGWGHRADDVLAWLRLVCGTPLPALGVALCDLPASTPELEFWFPSDGLHASRIDQLCRQHVLPGQARPGLPERTLHGLLMGFADLVFEHQGRFWVLDYKSNALGARDADYTPAALETAMLEHRYDVQAVLYLLALHRLLKSRLGAGYRPADQLGGAVYLFLRGVRGPSAGCCHVAPPLALLEALDALLPLAHAGGVR